MKSILVSVAALTLGVSVAQAQNAPSQSAASSASAGDNAQFIDKQDVGEFRAPKLVGVAVYDKDNKSVGKVSDLMLGKDGAVKAVVISVGGFLGIGSKYVAVPYSALRWQTEQRSAAVSSGPVTNDAMGGNAAGDLSRKSANGTSAGATDSTAPGVQARNVTADPAQTEAYQGYPDRAVIELSQAQLKSAPEFKYASNPLTPAPAAAPANGSMNEGGANSATKP